MKTPDIQTTSVVLPKIYAYTTPDNIRHNGWVKIGYTEQDNVEKRIKQQCHTAGLRWKTEWFGNAIYEGSHKTFVDKAFHAYLVKLGYEQEPNTEWFHIGTEESHHHFYEFRENHGIIKGKTTQTYRLRDSQEKAVQQTITSFTDNPDTEYLWNAKPRFGKTLAVYDLCQRMQFYNVLVVTNRPAIANSWYDDYLKFVGQEKYLFVCRIDALLKRKPTPCLSREQYIEHIKKPGNVKNCIEFVSLQDLKGSRFFGGSHDKLAEVYKLKWDLLVIDEAHEGVDTYKTDVAFDQIKRKHTLHLSGTPFKALANEKFPNNAIFNWTYADECKARENWNEDRGHNPYAEMPKLNMYTYRMSDIVIGKLQNGVNIDGDKKAYAFDLNEFFRVENNRFVHNEDVDKWIDALSCQSRYPFSTPELRHELRHTFWLLNRVDSARALARKLRDTKRHPEFSNFEIVVAAGNGKTDDDEIIEDDNSYNRVRKAINEHPDGTITLSVGQLTTGVTIPEWTAVMILSNMKSPSLYMQAAFRAQTPYLYVDASGKYHRKKNAYIFDFDPIRTLTNYEEMANGLFSNTASGNGDSDIRKKHIRELLNFFPVIGEDENGEMIQLDAEQVMRIPRENRSKEVVHSGFMSNFLFANISAIYSSSPGIIKIINQLSPVSAPKNSEVNADEVDSISHEIDDEGNVQPDPEQVSQLKNTLFGDKIYGEPKEALDQYVAESIQQYSKKNERQGKTTEEQIIDQISSQLTTVLLSQSEQMADKSHVDRLTKRKQGAAAIQIKGMVIEQLGESCRQVTKDKNDIDINCKNNCKGKTSQQQQELIQKAEEEKKAIDDTLTKTIQEKTKDLLNKGAEIIANAHEQQRIDNKKEQTNDAIRDHLRGFSRTIPSFLMGYGNESTTLQNFDMDVPDEVFVEVTSITKQQFHLLRDGGELINDETGEREFSPGHFFDEVVFNDAVRGFMSLRKRLANYFEASAEEDIFDYIPPQKTNLVFTPKWIVREMADLLEKENPGCFDNPQKTFADLYMKSGQYITEIVKRLYNSDGLCKAFPDKEARIRHIFRHQVYGLAPTECIYRIAINYILGFNDTIHIPESEHHLRMADSLPAAKNGTMEQFLEHIF